MSGPGSIWTILDLERTRDRPAIRRAYSRRLKQVHPEDDPEGFMRLRDAYERALVFADSGIEPLRLQDLFSGTPDSDDQDWAPEEGDDPPLWEPGSREPVHANPVDGHDVPVPHFGVVLDMGRWEALATRLRAAGVAFIIEPYVRFKGQVGEQATMFFLDPAGNALEFKAFADMGQIFAT